MKISKSKEELELKEKRIRDLLEEQKENNNKKEEVYRLYLEKMNMLEYIQNNRYYFEHPDFDERSLRGPILGKNKYTNELFVYDLEDRFVKIINMYNTSEEPKPMSLNQYFQKYSFEIAMKGLTSLLTFQDEAIEELENRNVKSKDEIEKYLNVIDSDTKVEREA